MLGYRPLVYFWIAEYTDGIALPQFDPETGKENRFAEVCHKNLVRFGWYPFTVELARKVLAAEKLIVIPTINKPYKVDIKKGQELVAYRTNQIDLKMRSSEIKRQATVYVLGIVGEEPVKIDERGEIVS